MVHGTLNIFFKIKLFCLSREKSESFSISLIYYFLKPHKISAHLNKLKLCKVSQNPKSNDAENVSSLP